MPKPSLYVKLVEITPSEASKMLASQSANRHISKSRVLQMADDMTHHRWVPNGESIKLDENGRLIDGQHRLAAAVKANFSLPTLLVSGLGSSAWETIDQGIKRSPGNVLQMMKPPVKHASNVAATCVTLWQLEKFGQATESSAVRPTRAQMLAAYRKHRGLEDTIRTCFTMRRHVGHLTLSQLATLHYWTHQNRPKEAAKFFAAISGEGEKIPAVTVLLARLRGRPSKRRYANLAMAIKAWNAYYTGKKLGSIKWAVNESFPDLEGARA